MIYLHCVLHVHCTHIDHMQVPPRQRVKTGVWEDSPLGRPHRPADVQGVPKKVTFWFFYDWPNSGQIIIFLILNSWTLKNNDSTWRWLVNQNFRKSLFWDTLFNMQSNGIGLRNYQKIYCFPTPKRYPVNHWLAEGKIWYPGFGLISQSDITTVALISSSWPLFHTALLYAPFHIHDRSIENCQE